MQKDIAKKKIRYCNIEDLDLTRSITLSRVKDKLLRNRKRVTIIYRNYKECEENY